MKRKRYSINDFKYLIKKIQILSTWFWKTCRSIFFTKLIKGLIFPFGEQIMPKSKKETKISKKSLPLLKDWPSSSFLSCVLIVTEHKFWISALVYILHNHILHTGSQWKYLDLKSYDFVHYTSTKNSFWAIIWKNTQRGT